MRMLQQRHAPVIFSAIAILMPPFRQFSTVHTYTICMPSRFDPLSRAFSNRYVFDENAQRIIEDRRLKLIEMHAFLNESASMWTKT